MGIVVVAIGVLGYFMYKMVFPSSGEPKGRQGDVLLTVPDAIVNVDSTSRLKSLTENSAERDYAQDYWNSLASGEGSSAVGDPFTDEEKVDPDDLDPNVYSRIERLQIKNGIYTKAEIDAKHEEERRQEEEEARLEAEEEARLRREEYEMSDRYQDSLADARMERAMAIMYKYAPAEQSAADSTEKERQYSKIDIPDNGSAYIPTESLQDDGIISSIRNPNEDAVSIDGKIVVKSTPAKATFLRSEKILSGQRVVMRLLQPLVLSTGDVIPANTHITGICSVSGRLEIEISTIQYAGKIYRTDYIAYDNDGTEGIYCPVQERKKHKGLKTLKRGLSTVSGLASSAFTGDSELGSIASSGMDEMTQEIGSDGSVAINIKAGYEFYIFEKPKNS